MVWGAGMSLCQSGHESSAPLELVDQLRRLLALAGTDEHSAIAAFDRIVQRQGKDVVLDALLVLAPGLPSEFPDDAAARPHDQEDSQRGLARR